MASLPDPIVISEVTTWPNVFMDIGKWFETIGRRHTFLAPLPMEKKGDIAWEIGGIHDTGIYICVRCTLKHGWGDQTGPGFISCTSARPHNISLNTHLAQHLRESKGVCIRSCHWFVLMRTGAYARDFIVKYDKKTEDFAKVAQDLEDICKAIDNLFPTLIDNDEEVDLHEELPLAHKRSAGIEFDQREEQSVDMIDVDDS